MARGEIVEAFACGTAAVITPIAVLNADVRIGMPDVADDERVSLSLREELTDIQYGRVADRTAGCCGSTPDQAVGDFPYDTRSAGVRTGARRPAGVAGHRIRGVCQVLARTCAR